MSDEFAMSLRCVCVFVHASDDGYDKEGHGHYSNTEEEAPSDIHYLRIYTTLKLIDLKFAKH